MATEVIPAPPAPLPPTRRSWKRRALKLILVAVAGLFAAEVLRVVAWTNRHTVLPGRVYRCSQPNEAELRELVGRHGIRTVINLRGASHGHPWYVEESKAAHALNVSQEDITFSANRLPAPAEVRQLIDVLDHTEYPVLIHCKRGADRTGLTSTIVMLLQTDATLDEARVQLGMRYGHFRFGRTAAMHEFFRLYESWLSEQNAAHTPDRFRTWARTVYSPGVANSELTWLTEPPNPVPADRPFAVKVKAVNRSQVPWEFRPGDFAGLHLSYLVATEGRVAIHRGKAGLLRKTVPPGGEIVFDVVVPSLKVPGRYVLLCEMHNATGSAVPFRVNSFVQFGDESLMTPVVVR